MFCYNCGKEIPDDMIFCPFCGIQVAEDELEGDSDQQTLGSDVGNQKQNEIKPNKQPKKGNSKTAVIIVAIIAALVVAGVAGFLFLGKGVSNDNTGSPEQPASSGDNILMMDKGITDENDDANGKKAEPLMFGQFNRGDFKKIVFLDSISNAPDNAWDVSQNQDNKVKAWIDETEGRTLNIAAEGGVYANQDCKALFACCDNLEEVNFNNAFHTENVTDMSYLFYKCTYLRTVDLSGIDTSSVTTMNRMFSKCGSLKDIDCTKINTDNVEDMYGMFFNCEALTSLDLSNWDTGNVKTMAYMFEKCRGLTSINLDGIDTSSVDSFRDMFYNCTSLSELDVSSFKTDAAESMYAMFSNCKSLKNINVSHFDTYRVTDMRYMFKDCFNIVELDVSSFIVSPQTKTKSMFCNCGSGALSVEGYEGWNVNKDALFDY